MNKERLTLLIALSIAIVVTIVIFLTGWIKAPEQTTVSTPTPSIMVEEVKDPDLIAGVALEIEKPVEEKIEEPKEEIIVEESAAAGSIAQQVWDAMKAKGWSDEVCAGIMGNLMAECGGGTLDLNPYCHGDSGTSYGLCQWHNGRKYSMLTFNNKNYNTTTNLPPIEHQIDYLEYELQDYNILNGDKTYQQVAYEFCVSFERPSNKYSKAESRKKLAQIAYQEFAI